MILIAIGLPQPVQAAACGDIQALVTESGWIYHNPISGGHVIEVTATSYTKTLPWLYEAVGTRTISLSDTNREMTIGRWSIYPKCGQNQPTATPFVTPTSTPRPVITPPPGEYCLRDEDLAWYLGVPTTRIHRDLKDNQHTDPSGWGLNDGDRVFWIPPLNYVVQYDGKTHVGNGQAQIDHRAASIWMPESCRTPKPTPTVVTPTFTPQGLVCLNAAQLATQLKVDVNRLTELWADNRLSGWAIGNNGSHITWIVPVKWIIQFGTGSLEGDGKSPIAFLAASIWMPIECRTGGAVPTATPTPSPTFGFTVATATPGATLAPPPLPPTPVTPTPGSAISNCSQIQALIEQRKWRLDDLIADGVVVELSAETELPLWIEAIGPGDTRIGLTGEPRKMAKGFWSVYAKCLLFLPTAISQTAPTANPTPVAQPTAGGNGILCLTAEQLAGQIKIGDRSDAPSVDPAWLTSLQDDKHRLGGWLLAGDGLTIYVWTIPKEWVLQFYGSGSLEGPSDSAIGFKAASIWMPLECRK